MNPSSTKPLHHAPLLPEKYLARRSVDGVGSTQKVMATNNFASPAVRSPLRNSNSVHYNLDRSIDWLVGLSGKLIMFILCVSLWKISGSGAIFSDLELSPENIFATSSLDLTVEPQTPLPTPETIGAGETATQKARWENAGGMDFEYYQKYEFVSGDQDLCDALTLSVNHLSDEKYHGPLANYSLNLTGGTQPDMLLPTGSTNPAYEYSFTLPLDADPSLGNKTCTLKITGFAWDPGIGQTGGYTDEEHFTTTINSGSLVACSVIEGYKYDDSGTGLKDWQIVIHKDTGRDADQTLHVEATDTDGESSMTLVDGHQYLVEATGTWEDVNQRQVDANFYSDDDWSNQANFDDEEDSDPRQLDLIIDDRDINWGTYQPTHLYKTLVEGEGKSINLRIFDNDPSSNRGFLIVRLFDVTNEIVTTDDTGHYQSAEICEQADYQVLEVLQPDWEIVKPESHYYHFGLPLGGERSFDFTNRKIKQNIVINEVHYDVDDSHGSERNSQNDEWVELYNNSNIPVNLKNWKLVDNNSEQAISHRNVWLPPHSFAVIAKAAQTWTYWGIPSDTVKIELGGNIGNGLDNDGDRIILKNSLDEEIDAVSWGSDTTAFTPSVPDVIDGHSIARNPVGHDTDVAADWADVTNPNPGTNPHSHIKVSWEQTKNHELLVNFQNAIGFNYLKYVVGYSRTGDEGDIINEAIVGEASKPTGQENFSLPPIYLGTCSTDGICTPNTGIKNGFFSLLYKLDANVLGTSTYEFTWDENEDE